MALNKVIGIVFIFILLAGWLKEWFLIPLGLFLLYLLVRFIADIFWCGRDDGRW